MGFLFICRLSALIALALVTMAQSAIVVEEGAQSARGTTIITNPYLPLVTIPLRGDGRFELTVRGQTDVRNTLVPAGADCYGTPSYGFQSTPLVAKVNNLAQLNSFTATAFIKTGSNQMNKDRPIFHIHMEGGEQRGIDLVAGSVAFPRQIGLIFDERDYVGVQAKTEVWSTVECTTPDEWHFIAVSYDHTTDKVDFYCDDAQVIRKSANRPNPSHPIFFNKYEIGTSTALRGDDSVPSFCYGCSISNLEIYNSVLPENVARGKRNQVVL